MIAKERDVDERRRRERKVKIVFVPVLIKW